MKVKNYFQRESSNLEPLAAVAETKKQRGEPTGPLPVPTVTPKRRYESTPSAVAPRLIAPHTDSAETDETLLVPKVKQRGRSSRVSPQPPALQARPTTEKERVQSKYPPIAQATTGAPTQPVIATGNDEQRPIRPQVGQQPQQQRVQQQGPRVGYFSDDRREAPSGAAATAVSPPPASPFPAPRAQETKPAKKGHKSHKSQQRSQQISPKDIPRAENVKQQNIARQPQPIVPQQSQEMHTSPQYPLATSSAQQQAYMQQQQQQQPVRPTIYPVSHSRNASAATSPNSPAQPMMKQEADMGAVAVGQRDTFGQALLQQQQQQHQQHQQQQSMLPQLQTQQHMNPYGPTPVPVQSAGGARHTPVVSPVKEIVRPTSTPAQQTEPPRHVPAKRSNIMSILNDEPEEPQPRKKFASDQSPSVTPVNASPARPVYMGPQPMAQPSLQSRREEPAPTPPTSGRKQHGTKHSRSSRQSLGKQTQAQQQAQSQAQQPSGPGRSYSEHGNYAATAAPDWMARFDPRGQQQQQQQQQVQSHNDHRASTQQQSSSLGYVSGSVPSQAPQHHSQQQPQHPGYHAQPMKASSQPSQSIQPAIQTQTQPQPQSHIVGTSRDPAQLPPGQAFRNQADSPREHVNMPFGPRQQQQASIQRQRPSTPVQSSPVTALGIGQRQHSGPAPSYAPGPSQPQPPQQQQQNHPHGPTAHHSHSQPYGQHVQQIVGQHQHQQPAQHQHRSSLGPGAPPMGRNTPPPQPQAQPAVTRPGPGQAQKQPQSLGLARSYTPPSSALHQHQQSQTYPAAPTHQLHQPPRHQQQPAPPPQQQQQQPQPQQQQQQPGHHHHHQHNVQHIHSRHPAGPPVATTQQPQQQVPQPTSNTHHHRVYSQGSTPTSHHMPGPGPGQIHPQSGRRH